jgi:hypothetical protein
MVNRVVTVTRDNAFLRTASRYWYLSASLSLRSLCTAYCVLRCARQHLMAECSTTIVPSVTNIEIIRVWTNVLTFPPHFRQRYLYLRLPGASREIYNFLVSPPRLARLLRRFIVPSPYQPNVALSIDRRFTLASLVFIDVIVVNIVVSVVLLVHRCLLRWPR